MTTLSEDIDNVRSTGSIPSFTAARPETRHGARPNQAALTLGSTVGGMEARLATLETNVDHILEILTQMNQRQGLYIRILLLNKTL